MNTQLKMCWHRQACACVLATLPYIAHADFQHDGTVTEEPLQGADTQSADSHMFTAAELKSWIERTTKEKEEKRWESWDALGLPRPNENAPSTIDTTKEVVSALDRATAASASTTSPVSTAAENSDTGKNWLANIFNWVHADNKEPTHVSGTVINAHLYAIFCEDSEHPFRKEACGRLFLTIIDDLDTVGGSFTDEQVKTIVRDYKYIYNIID